MAKGKKNPNVMPRSVKFEIFPSEAEVVILEKINEHLRCFYNRNLGERRGWYKKEIYPLDKAIFADPLPSSEELKALKDLRKQVLEYLKGKLTFYGQVYALTHLRKKGNYGLYLRTWQEETLDSVDAGYKSFFSLRKNGDFDAKPPFYRTKGFFYKIPARSKKDGDSFGVEGGNLKISLGQQGEPLFFPIPQEYQQKKLDERIKTAKLELYRNPRDLSKPGRFWVSVTYYISKPLQKPCVPENTVYLALGASRLGIVSPKGELCLNLPRPDYHWKPAISVLEERLGKVAKGSRKWKKRMAARAKMFAKLGHQQKHHGQYEVIQKLLCHGIHFVVTELQVRSKAGALANASDPSRSGAPFAPNWSAQNTGNIGRLVQKLTDKAAEHGGSVIKRKPPLLSLAERQLSDNQRKILIARKLREEFLADQK